LEKVPTCLINVFYSYFFKILEAPGVKACGAMIELGMVGRGPTYYIVVSEFRCLMNWFWSTTFGLRLQIFDI